MTQYQYVGDETIDKTLTYTSGDGQQVTLTIHLVTNDIISLPENDPWVQNMLATGKIHPPRDAHQ
jgi:hypothetical protein